MFMFRNPKMLKIYLISPNCKLMVGEHNVSEWKLSDLSPAYFCVDHG